jgi:hypothetical protein
MLQSLAILGQLSTLGLTERPESEAREGQRQ